MITSRSNRIAAAFAALSLWTLAGSLVGLMADERTQRFDANPNWDAWNNRATTPAPRTIRQDFGYSPTRHAAGAGGEIGGWIEPAAETAYYAKPIPQKTFADPLDASGTFFAEGRQFHIMLGFFNSGTLKEWRTPNSVALRLYGRGDVFYAYLEYATSRWRAGGDSPRPFPMLRDARTGRQTLKGFARGVPHRWTLKYDPQANRGDGAVIATLDGDTAVCNLDAGHKSDGAAFNRFGLFNVVKTADQGGEVWFDDLTIDGRREAFATDPGWDQLNNRRTYVTNDVRPRFDFGFRPTNHAGGRAAGELGGLVFRGDNRSPLSLAYYGDRLEPLDLDKPLAASGKIALRRAVSDSTTLIGFFHSKVSMQTSAANSTGFPRNFLGLSIEGPSREGFLCYPAFHIGEGSERNASGERAPHILPDGAAHDWTLRYEPSKNGGRVTASLDGKSVDLEMSPADRAAAKSDGRRGGGPNPSRAVFDRFGIVTTWIDGNGQRIYFDDLRYTFRQ